MRIELENKLAEDFSFMGRKKSFEEQKENGYIGDLYGAFGCDVDDGWYGLLHSMCDEIVKTYKERNLPVDIVPAQVKEKYGSLCFYFYFDTRERTNCTDKETSDERTCVSLKDYEEVHNKIADIVSSYENKSIMTCASCGNPGKLRRDIGWIVCLCEECYKDKKKDLRNGGHSK